MPTGFSGKCFISGELMRRADLGSGDFIQITSPTHGVYRVSRSAIPALVALDPEARLSAFQKAQAHALASGEQTPMIIAEHC